MGSVSDYEVMAEAVAMLEAFGVDFEKRVVSAHRTPDLLCEYAKTARERGIGVIIAGAGGAAHLPGMVASMTPLPVVGVPVKSRALNGLDSLLSIVQMPAGVPVATTPQRYPNFVECKEKAGKIFVCSRFELDRKLLLFVLFRFEEYKYACNCRYRSDGY